MGLSQYILNYTKSWRNHEDFSTYEPNEARVRDDLQCLFDEMRDAFNAFLAGLAAGDIPFEASAAIDEDNVQDAIENVQEQLEGISQGAVPDGSITAAKLADGAATEDKIGSGAVTAAKLSDGAVLGAKLADGAVSSTKLADNAVAAGKLANSAVSTAKIIDLAVTAAKLAANAVETAKIKAAAVTTEKIADANVTAAKLASSAVETAKIKDANVTAAKLASSAVETAKIKDAAVTEAKLASSAVTAGKIASNAVETAKIKDANVTQAKLAANAVSISLGSVSIPNSSWTTSGGAKYKDVSVTGLLTTDTLIIDVNITSTVAATISSQMDGWAEFFRFSIPSNGTLRVWAMDTPGAAVPIKIHAIRR